MDYFEGMEWPGYGEMRNEMFGLCSGMSDRRYYEVALQVPACEVPDDCTVAERRFELARHGGMILLRLGPVVPGPEGGETYSVLLATSHAQRIIETLLVILANLGR
jgi:hypothetical protein